MQRSNKLIRYGLWLVPWLPAFLLTLFAYAYFSAPRYRAATTLELRPPPGETPFPSAPPPPRSYVPQRITLPLVFLVGITVAFVVGCGLVLVGFFTRTRTETGPPPST